MRKFKEKHPILYRVVTLADFRECLNEYVKKGCREWIMDLR